MVGYQKYLTNACFSDFKMGYFYFGVGRKTAQSLVRL
jgi:hypothetical protein